MHDAARQSVIIRPTIASDLAQLTTEPLPFRIKAMTGLVDCRVIGVAGLAFPPGGTVIAFAELTEEARAHKFAMHRAAVRFLRDEVRDRGIVRLVASADPQFAAAQRWLARLGFARLVREDADGRPVEDERVWVLTCSSAPAATTCSSNTR